MDTESIDEEVKVEKADSGNVLGSSLRLIAVLAGLCLLYMFYPQLTEGLDKLSAKTDNEADLEADAGAEVSGNAVVETAPVKQMPQAPKELKAWIPLVEAELPQREGVSYRLIHLRMSYDRAKLLVDLEKKSSEGAIERFDLILIRDDFGRYVSGLHEVPMRLYPPDELKEEE